jgi:hypothetical protein
VTPDHDPEGLMALSRYQPFTTPKPFIKNAKTLHQNGLQDGRGADRAAHQPL